jgi:hypothetical protein
VADLIRITDGNAYYRRVLETDPTGLAPRSIIGEIRLSQNIEIWVWDGFQGNDRRRAIYPDYKGNRKGFPEDIRAGMKLLKKALRHTGAIQVSVPGYEGDDVIATLSRKLPGKIHIRSHDMDLAALVGGNVTCEAKIKHDLTPDLVKLYKICVGDPSDNIKGIKGFGAKTWEQADKVELKKVIDHIVADDQTELDLDPLAQTVPLKILHWIVQNKETIRSYNQIIDFFDVPDDLMDQHTIPGDRDYPKAEAVLTEFMQ